MPNLKKLIRKAPLKPLFMAVLAAQATVLQAQMFDVIDLRLQPGGTLKATAFGQLHTTVLNPKSSPAILRGEYVPRTTGNVNDLITSNLTGTSQTLWIRDLTIAPNVAAPYKIVLAAVAPETGNADSNSLIIDGASSNLSGVDTIVAGATGSGSANGNTLTINGNLSVKDNIYLAAGKTASGNASQNKLTINGDLKVPNIYAIDGGRSDTNGSADGNSVTMNGSGTVEWLHGGNSPTGASASSNKVDLSFSGTIQNLFGGESTQAASDNKVYLHASNTPGAKLTVNSLTSGNAEKASLNLVEIDNGAEVEVGTLIGGHGQTEADANKVFIYGGTRFDNIIGGLGEQNGGYTGYAQRNKVTIDAATASAGMVMGGLAQNAESNEVVIKQAKAAEVIGGAGTVAANQNYVQIEGATAHNVTGGTADKQALGNKVFINNAAVTQNTYGAHVIAPNGEMWDNHVFLNGTTTVAGDVYGAYSDDPNPATISNNSVTLTGTVKVTGSVYAAATAGQGTIGDKNELVFKGKTSAGNIGGFTDLHLLVSEENLLTNNDEYVLTLTGANSLDLTGKNIDVYDFRNNTSHPNGEKFGLIKVASTQGGTPAIQLGGNVTLHNTFIDKKWEVKNESAGELYLQGEKLIIQPSDPNNPGGSVVITPNTEANVNSQSLSQNRLSSIASANQSAQFAADSGLNAMKDQLYGKNWFFAGEGGMNKYGRGFNKIELNGGSLLTGLMNNFDGTLLGGFFEASWGHASSKENVFSAKSNIQSYGVGVLASREIYPNWEVDGSLRFGWMRNSFKGRYFDVDGSSDFKTNMAYVSGHIGTAYNFSVSDQTTISPYARYIVSYLGSDKVNAGSVEEDKYKANATVSHTLRAGVKVKTQLTENFKFVGGVAIDETMGAKTKGRINGYDLKTLSVNGTTAVGELKLQAVPTSTSPWKFEVGVKGYAGKRGGVIGDASVNYRF